MKQARTLALLAMAAAVVAAGAASPAEAKTGAASTATKAKELTKTATAVKAESAAKSAKAVRLAWVAGCTKKGEQGPCGPWRLVLRGGKTVALADALVRPLDADGKVDTTATAPLAVSGNGRRLVYVRKSDHRLVWKDLGGARAHLLPGRTSKVPKGLGMPDVDLALSPDGDRLLIDYADASDKLPTLIIPLRGGHVAKLPGGEAVQGFSPDGRHLLAARITSDNTTRFVVYDTEGKQVESREVPQVVSNNSPVALADDGVTVGVVVSPASGRPRLRQYDLSSDTVSPAVTLHVRSDETPIQLAWDKSGGLTLWTAHAKSNDAPTSRVTASTVDPADGRLIRVDSFRVKPSMFDWKTPGE
ncbi:hypothetical protein [Sphaerisporangium fuscum]|uniref:hypothetical protein n=1 Tax=Sphaerisporangium fuscum TaxID=2835868 RepID=UPI001BDC74CF|nr:hypothetical protein [Sphaerisporangium fuscum]